MNSVSGTKNCYGCGICAVVCPKNVISIKYDKNGFYAPVFEKENSCVDCGLCQSVCSYNSDDLVGNNIPLRAFAGWSNDQIVRKSCSSGGVAFEVGRYLISEGYRACGVLYNSESNRTEHFVAETVDEFKKTIGSKYLQSYTVDAFKSIDLAGRYLVTGTPCQIDSFRRYLEKHGKEDNFVLMDSFCHGVPSKMMWNKYYYYVRKKTGQIKSVLWREKTKGWNDSYSMTVYSHYDRTPSYVSRLSEGDPFYRIFFSDSCLGKACYKKCKFKYDKSSADIRVGDLWGYRGSNSKDGVSAVVSFSEKGEEVLQHVDCHLIPMSFESVSAGQMRSNPKLSANYHVVKVLIKIPFVPISLVSFEVRTVQFFSRLVKHICHN